MAWKVPGSSSVTTCNFSKIIKAMATSTIDDLPNEILEYIFHLLPPYEDVRCCMAVSKKWHEIAKRKLAKQYLFVLFFFVLYDFYVKLGIFVTDVIPRVKHSFSEALGIQNVSWEASCSKRNSITKRYAHSACRHRKYL